MIDVRSAKIIWARPGDSVEPHKKHIRVMDYHKDRETEAEHRLYNLSGGATWAWWREAADIRDLFFMFFHLTTEYGLDPGEVGEEFMKIDGFERALAQWLITTNPLHDPDDLLDDEARGAYRATRFSPPGSKMI